MRRLLTASSVALLSTLASVVLALPTAQAAAPQWQPLLSLGTIDFATVDPLYRAAIERDADVATVTAELQAYADQSAHPKRQRANALLVGSYLLWRFGQLPTALEWTARAAKLDTSADLALQQARLLEAAGDLVQAHEYYEQAFQLLQDPKRKEQVRLRMTFVAMGQQNIDELVRLAESRDRDFRNRAAVALAVMGHDEEASRLYQVSTEGSDRFRQHLRLAQWALAAKQASAAQEQAWQAVQVAPLDRDRLYALSVLIDAHELDKSEDRLLERFKGKATLSPEEQRTRIDLLQRLGHYEAAIQLFNEGGERSEITAASRRQLLRIYSEAGRTEDMVAEYRKLIAAHPAEVLWPAGLSQYLLEQGDRPGVESLWREFIARNSRKEILLAGAQAMGQFGLDELAIAATDKLLVGDPQSVSAALMFRFELALRRGRAKDAEAVLAEMDRLFAADAMERVELADAYGRIKKPLEAVKVLEALDRSRANGIGTDGRMKMAWLYDSIGQRDKALKTWKDLWNGQSTDASRRLVEDRMVTLAAESGTLGDLAVELEGNLAAGTANKKDSTLLIRIYTDTGDTASAVEVIREYFKQSKGTDLQSLREQAKVFHAMGRYGAFKRLTTRLLQLDPDNKADYLQFLVLNELENGGQLDAAKTEQIKGWLKQLQGASTDAANSEFEAGIMVLAGMPDEAIATYHQALARNPDHGDNYLLLANLLVENERRSEAITMLQYVVETAAQDDDFIVGVDGILNTKTQDVGVLEWAQRRVLERLAARDDKQYLYELLGELAEASGDKQMYFSALENSLAYANARRSSVLRELISATAEKNAMFEEMAGGRLRATDPERNQRYSRRLISLGEELPPQVYMDVGKAFLKAGDAKSAENAFNMAVDRTGEDSLVEETGDLFRDAGYSSQAAAQYKKAFVADPNNVALMGKMADMQARRGDSDAANETYLQALLQMMQTLAPELEKIAARATPTLASTASNAYRQNYPRLLAGFLYSLPQGSNEKFADLQRAIEEALQEAERKGGKISKELAYYPRLDALSQFASDVAARSGRQVLAPDVSRRLAGIFGATAPPDAPSAEVSSAGVLQRLIPEKDAAAQALVRKQYRLAIDIGQHNKDRQFVNATYRKWVTDVLQQPDSDAAAAPRVGGDPNSVYSVLQAARSTLEEAEYQSLSRYVLELAGSRAELQSKLLIDPSIGPGITDDGGKGPIERYSALNELEKVAGRALVSPADLRELLMRMNAHQLGVIDSAYVMKRLPLGDGIDVFEKMLAARGEGELQPIFFALRTLLSQPLNPQQSARVRELIQKELQKLAAGAGEAGVTAFGGALYGAHITRGMAVENAALVEELDGIAAAASPQSFTAGTLRVDALIAAGRVREALPLMVDILVSAAGGIPGATMGGMQIDSGLASEPSNIPAYISLYAHIIFPQYKAEMITLAQAKQPPGQELELRVFQLLLALETQDPRRDPAQFLSWLENMAAQHAESEAVLIALIGAYEAYRYTDMQVQAAEKLVALAPLNPDYRKYLFDLWRRLDNPAAAVQVANHRLAALVQANSAEPPAMSDDVFLRTPALQRALEPMRAVDTGGDVNQARNALSMVLRMLPLPGVIQTPGGEMQYQIDYLDLFSLDWVPPPLPQHPSLDVPGAAEASASLPLERIPGGMPRNGNPFSRAGKFLTKIVEYDYALPELEAQLRTLRPEDLQQQYLMYGAMAEAYRLHGRLDAELSRLTQRVDSAEASLKDAALLLELMARLPQAQIKALLPAAERALSVLGSDGSYRRLLAARVYAHAGDDARAVGIYSGALLAAQSIRESTEAERGSPEMNAIALYAEAQQHLSAAGLENFTAVLLNTVRPDDKSAGADAYEQWILWILELNPASTSARAQLQQLLQVPLRPDLPGWHPVAEELETVAALARQGQLDRALQRLARVLRQPQQENEQDGDNYSRYQGYQGMLGMDGRSTMGRFKYLDRFSQIPFLQEAARVFPAQADAWPGVLEWTQRVAAALPAWIAEASIDRSKSMELLALVTLRLHQLGAAEAAQASAQQLARYLAPYEKASAQDATLVVSVLEQVQAPLDAGMLQTLIQRRRVSVKLLGPVLQQVARQSGAEQALALGEIAMQYTQNDVLLQQVRKLASDLGRTAVTQQVDKIAPVAANARAVLERVSPAG